MDRDTALKRIKKCLALSQSANANEAATALRQAQKLMEQFGIDDATLATSEVEQASTHARFPGLPAWEVALAQEIAKAFGCEVIIMRGHRLALNPDRRHTRYEFIGVGAASEVAAYAMKVLGRQCAKDRLAHIAQQPRNCKSITKTARGDAFATGWVLAVAKVLDRFNGTERNQALLQAYIAQHFPSLQSIKPKTRDVGRNVRPSSYADGVKAGSNAELHRGVGGLAEQGRLEHG